MQTQREQEWAPLQAPLSLQVQPPLPCQEAAAPLQLRPPEEQALDLPCCFKESVEDNDDGDANASFLSCMSIAVSISSYPEALTPNRAPRNTKALMPVPRVQSKTKGLYSFSQLSYREILVCQ